MTRYVVEPMRLSLGAFSTRSRNLVFFDLVDFLLGRSSGTTSAVGSVSSRYSSGRNSGSSPRGRSRPVRFL